MTASLGARTPPDVLVVGRANVDLSVHVPCPPSAGRTVFGSELATTPGGKGVNQAIAVARLGGAALLVANVGDDQWGRLLMSALTEVGVDVSRFRLLAETKTGAAIIEITPDGENHLVLALSPRTELTKAQVSEAITDTQAPIVVVQLDMPPEPVHAALTAARQGIVRIGNLAPHPDLDPSLLRHLDLLVVNQYEAAEILGEADADPAGAADRLRQLGPTAVVVTAGADGACYSYPADRGAVAAPTVQAHDTTGAGDAFLGSLALDLSRDMRFADAVGRAVQVGAEAVRNAGSLLPRIDHHKRTRMATPSANRPRSIYMDDKGPA